jgi:thiol-disulfide isomerase/thioredoxin
MADETTPTDGDIDSDRLEPGGNAGGPAQAPPTFIGRRPSRKAAWLAMGAVALALALVSLAPAIDSRSDDDEHDPADSAIVGRPAPLHYTLKDMNGVDVKLASFKGKVILVNFWATWCPPCEAEIPWLVEIQKAHPDDLVILGVSTDDSPEMLKPFAAKLKMNYPVLVGVDHQDVQDAFGPLGGLPTSVFVGRDGIIMRRHSGMLTKEQFEREIESLL